MESTKQQNNYFGTEKVGKILLKLAPPVMLAQLIQALYNIVDSIFVGKYSDFGLTALSIVYPLQLLMIALAVGVGVGINTVMAAKFGIGEDKKAYEYAGVAAPLALVLWVLFAVFSYFFMPLYARLQTDSPQVTEDVITYGRTVCVCSFGIFLESVWTKVLQAKGDMKTPMIAQIIGAVVNIVLDPILIFGMFGLREMGVRGAAVATVAGQVAAALAVMKKGFVKSPPLNKYFHCVTKIFKLGLPNILMQSAYTLYIFGLNMILATFSDAAVTVLGLYYKWQSFFFIPVSAMQTCIVPVISFNYASKKIDRCKKTLNTALLFGGALMILGTLCFEIIPEPMIKLFSGDTEVIREGVTAFRIIGLSFVPLAVSLTYPVLFQAVGKSLVSSALTVIRTVFLFVPLAYAFSRFGLKYFWLTYPVTDIVVSLLGFFLSVKFFASLSQYENKDTVHSDVCIKPSVPGVVVTIARTHGSCGKQIGKLLAEKLSIPFYYKEMTALAAKECGFDKEFVSDINKNSPQVLRELYLSKNAVKTAVEAQHKIIKRIAENGSCVIVGRAADYVLRDSENLFSVFVNAPMEYRISKVGEIYGDSHDEAEENIRRSDAARGAYYKNISGMNWSDESHYDLTVDSSEGIEKSVEIIFSALREKSKIENLHIGR